MLIVAIDDKIRLKAALRSLCNEVRGLLAIAEPAIREATGHTNVNCLHRRLEEAEVAMSKDRQQAKE